MPAMGLPLTLNFVLVVVGTDSSDAGWDWKNSCLDLGGWARLLPKMVSGRELCVDGLVCEAREGRDKRRVYSSSDKVAIKVIAHSKKRVNL